MGRCAGAAVGISVKPLDKRVGAHTSGRGALNACASVGRVPDFLGRDDGDSQFRAPRSDAAYITPSLLLLGWRRRRRRRNLRRTLWGRCWRRFHILQFDLKNQGRVRTDVRTHCTLAVREGRGNDQLIL